MNLTREKKWIKEQTNSNLPLKVQKEFLNFKTDIDSYYYRYSDCRHYNNKDILKYDFGCIAELKIYLDALWKDDPELQCMIPAILSGAEKYIVNKENEVRQIDCYNYVF